ncbi:hypothetical protein N7539_008065, partial [Penicillium diatomitis]
MYWWPRLVLVLVLSASFDRLSIAQELNSRLLLYFPRSKYFCVGPEVAYWKISGRVEIYTVINEDARRGLGILSGYENVKAGLNCSYAVIKVMEIAKELGPG